MIRGMVRTSTIIERERLRGKQDQHLAALILSLLSACAKTIAHPIFWKLPPEGAASKKSGKEFC
jgi:hypothetical protein